MKSKKDPKDRVDLKLVKHIINNLLQLDDVTEDVYSIAKKKKAPTTSSKIIHNNSEQLNLSGRQTLRRRNGSISALEEIHCASLERDKKTSVNYGMWVTHMLTTDQ